MVNFLIVLLPSFIVIALKWYYYKDKGNKYGNRSIGTIDPSELLMSLGAAVVVAGLSLTVFVMSVHYKALDHEIWNGYVTDKKRQRVPCNHMEDCNCRTEKDSHGNDVRKCDSCPEHPYDVDWTVYTTVGNMDISRLSRRGLEEPPRFTAVKIGEPASTQNRYLNYLLLDKTSTLVYDTVNTSYAIPSYPKVYDYYRYNRVLNYSKADTSWLNNYLNEWLKTKGSAKQLNLIVVFVEQPEEYFYHLISAWRGAKKNDLIMVFGMQGNTIAWQRNHTYANGMNNRHLLEELRSYSFNEPFSRELIDGMLERVEAKYTRIEASQFEDKVKFVKPPIWLYVLVILINLIISIVIARKHLRT